MSICLFSKYRQYIYQVLKHEAPVNKPSRTVVRTQ